MSRRRACRGTQRGAEQANACSRDAWVARSRVDHLFELGGCTGQVMNLETNFRRRSARPCNWNSLLQLLLHVFLANPLFLGNSAVSQEERQQVKTSEIRVADSGVSTSLAGQEPGDAPSQTLSEQGKSSGRRGSLIVAPLPISSPALGTGVVP